MSYVSGPVRMYAICENRSRKLLLFFFSCKDMWDDVCQGTDQEQNELYNLLTVHKAKCTAGYTIF